MREGRRPCVFRAFSGLEDLCGGEKEEWRDEDGREILRFFLLYIFDGPPLFVGLVWPYI